MSIGVILWLGVCALVGVVWTMRHWTLSRAARENRRLSPLSHPCFDAEAPRLSVLVAAKDEQDNIETCVLSLLDQD
jgi:hypothetical protein